MSRLETRNFAVVLLILGLGNLAFACRREGEDGNAARASVACAKVCSLGLQVTHETKKLDCGRDCVTRVVGSNRRCESLVLAWLDCLAAVTSKVDATGAVAGTAPQLQRCGLEQQFVERCEEGCRLEGLLRSGETSVAVATGMLSVKYELTHCGCATCRAERGAEALSPCHAAKVCSEYLFACDAGVTKLRLRACAETQCADEKTAAVLLGQLLMGQRCTLLGK